MTYQSDIAFWMFLPAMFLFQVGISIAKAITRQKSGLFLFTAFLIALCISTSVTLCFIVYFLKNPNTNPCIAAVANFFLWGFCFGIIEEAISFRT